MKSNDKNRLKSIYKQFGKKNRKWKILLKCGFDTFEWKSLEKKIYIINVQIHKLTHSHTHTDALTYEHIYDKNRVSIPFSFGLVWLVCVPSSNSSVFYWMAFLRMRRQQIELLLQLVHLRIFFHSVFIVVHFLPFDFTGRRILVVCLQ